MAKFFWKTIFGEAVFKRFTAYLDPHHLEPWYFYFLKTWRVFADAGSEWLAAIGVLALTRRAWQGRPWLARLIWLWGIVPVALISVGTSKIFYYDYPYLPPIALGVGVAAAAWLAAAKRWLCRLPFERWRLDAVTARPWARRVCATVAVLALLLALWTLLVGPVDWRVSGVRSLGNTSVICPLIIGLVFAYAASLLRPVLLVSAVIALIGVLPVQAYSANLSETRVVDRPLHVLRDCAVRQVRSGAAPRDGIYQVDPDAYTHPYYYYFRSLEPWVADGSGVDVEIGTRLFVPGRRTPVLVPELEWPGVRARVETAVARGLVPGLTPPLPWRTVRALDGEGDFVVLLPGPFAPCLDAAVAEGGHVYRLEPAPAGSR